MRFRHFLLLASLTIFFGLCSHLPVEKLPQHTESHQNIPSALSTLRPGMPQFFGEVGCPDDDVFSSLIQLNVPPTTAAPSTINFEAFGVFCGRAPQAVLCVGHPGGRLLLSVVRHIDEIFLTNFKYRTDVQIYNKDDYWANWSVCGDCEDYALTMSELLAQAGEGGSFMRLEIMRIGEFGHATLLVETINAGVWEIGVDMPMLPYNPKTYTREMSIRMDGKRHPIAHRGYVIDLKKYVVAPK